MPCWIRAADVAVGSTRVDNLNRRVGHDNLPNAIAQLCELLGLGPSKRALGRVDVWLHFTMLEQIGFNRD